MQTGQLRLAILLLRIYQRVRGGERAAKRNWTFQRSTGTHCQAKVPRNSSYAMLVHLDADQSVELHGVQCSILKDRCSSCFPTAKHCTDARAADSIAKQDPELGPPNARTITCFYYVGFHFGTRSGSLGHTNALPVESSKSRRCDGHFTRRDSYQ